MDLIATSAFGLEAVLKREIESLGYEIISTQDGKVTFKGDERAMFRANLCLRTADRVYIKLAEFKASETEDYFQMMKGISWEEWFHPRAKIIINGTCVKSKLASVSLCQSLGKKAIITRLSEAYMIDKFPEDEEVYNVNFKVLKDVFTISLETSGDGLHKRGYRKKQSQAPIRETLASALVQLSFWNRDRILLDTCCGSGTIPIEAAMIARNIAPGLSRKFAFEEWSFTDKSLLGQVRSELYKQIDYSFDLNIHGWDIDKNAIEISRENALEAGVLEDINFIRNDIKSFPSSKLSDDKRGVIITNPPYGVRIGSKAEVEKVNLAFKNILNNFPAWSLFLVNDVRGFDKEEIGIVANRRRKLYNGKLQICYYQFFGKKVDD